MRSPHLVIPAEAHLHPAFNFLRRGHTLHPGQRGHFCAEHAPFEPSTRYPGPCPCCHLDAVSDVYTAHPPGGFSQWRLPDGHGTEWNGGEQHRGRRAVACGTHCRCDRQFRRSICLRQPASLRRRTSRGCGRALGHNARRVSKAYRRVSARRRGACPPPCSDAIFVHDRRRSHTTGGTDNPCVAGCAGGRTCDAV